MPRDIDQQLSGFKEKDYTVRLCRAVFKVVPPAPELTLYQDMEGAAASMGIQAGPRTLARARELAAGEGPQATLWMANALDNADSGLSVYSGVRSAVKLYKSRRGDGTASDALSTDNQQAADAVLKGLGLSYMIHKLIPGSPSEKVAKIRALPSGEALLYYYAAIEIGLPFADNALLKGGAILDDLFDRLGASQIQKLAQIAGDDKAQEATGMMSNLLEPMHNMVSGASAYLSPLATTASETLPQAMNVADKLAGAVATGADLLPVYRYMGARMVAEACLMQAVDELGPEVGTEVATEISASPPLPAALAAAEPIARQQIPTPAPRPVATPPAPPKKRSALPVVMAIVVLATLGIAGGIGAVLFMGSSTSDGGSSYTSEQPATTTPSRPSGTKTATRRGKK